MILVIRKLVLNQDIPDVSEFETSGVHCILSFDFQLKRGNSKKEDGALGYQIPSSDVWFVVLLPCFVQFGAVMTSLFCLYQLNLALGLYLH